MGGKEAGDELVDFRHFKKPNCDYKFHFDKISYYFLRGERSDYCGGAWKVWGGLGEPHLASFLFH